MQAIDIQSEEFLESLRLGKQEAFQVLFEAFHKPLCFFAARVVRDGEEAEDIVQEVFLSFWKMERDGFPNIKTIKTFFYNSVQNRCLNYLRDLDAYVAWSLKTSKADTYNTFRVLKGELEKLQAGKLLPIVKPIEYSGWGEETVFAFDRTAVDDFLKMCFKEK